MPARCSSGYQVNIKCYKTSRGPSDVKRWLDSAAPPLPTTLPPPEGSTGLCLGSKHLQASIREALQLFYSNIPQPVSSSPFLLGGHGTRPMARHIVQPWLVAPFHAQ